MKKLLVVSLLILVTVGSLFAAKGFFVDAGVKYSMSAFHFADTSCLMNEYGLNLRSGSFITENLKVFGNFNTVFTHSIHNYQTFSRIPASIIYTLDAGVGYCFDNISVSAAAGLKLITMGFNNPLPNRYMMIDFAADAKYTFKSKGKTNFGVSVPFSFSFSKNGYIFSWGIVGSFSYGEDL